MMDKLAYKEVPSAGLKLRRADRLSPVRLLHRVANGLRRHLPDGTASPSPKNGEEA